MDYGTLSARFIFTQSQKSFDLFIQYIVHISFSAHILELLAVDV